jgi:hypothetical protein
MIEFTEASIRKFIVHRVGNKLRDEGLELSTRTVEPIDDDFTTNVLKRYFFAPFRGDVFFNFSHASSLEMNAIYRESSAIFDREDDFVAASELIAKQLYEASLHPKISGGELYVVLLNDVIVEGEVCDAVGIFKSESNQPFLSVKNLNGERYVVTERGINPFNLDKGCLIFNTEREAGYKICVVDNTTRNGDAVYWKEAFLQVKPREDSYYKTRTYLDVCKQFVKEVFNEDNDVDPADRVDMLNRTAQYFKENEVFNAGDFEAKVLAQPEIVEAFKDYKDKYSTLYQVKVDDEFTISSGVVKGMAKQFKSLIKLDKNFHIYMHGNRELMEKGYDSEKKMSFYKIYFDTETV